MEHAFGFIVKSKDKYLICHPFASKWKDGFWSLPKGHAKPGETELESALRETKEETGIDLEKQKGKISKLGTFAYPNGKKQITIFLFEGEDSLRFKKASCQSLITRGKNKGKPEIDLCTWVSLKEAKAKLHSSVIQALNMLKDK